MIPLPHKRHIGHIGETAAAAYLLSHGYRILERNFRKPHGDIDIVALEGNTLVFVEVKTRTSDTFGTPEDAITPKKRALLVRSCEYFRSLHPDSPDSMRIDMVSVRLSSSGAIENIALYRNVTG